jgi:hypothetical protein
VGRFSTAIDSGLRWPHRLVYRPGTRRDVSIRRRVWRLLVLGVLTVGLWPSAALARVDWSVAASLQVEEAPEPTPVPTCVDGRLRVADLPAIQDVFGDGVAAERTKAERWQDDARLVGLRVACRLLDDGFSWRGIFFSDAIQTYFFSDTGETRTVDVVAPPGPTLPLSDVDFRDLHQSLLRAGFDESAELSPSSNVEIRLNSSEAPFGPPEVPQNEVYFHVAIEFRGDVIDLFVSADDGTPYQFQT